MSFIDKAQTLWRRFTGGAPAEEDESVYYSRRHDGSVSGYHPNAGRHSQRMQPVQQGGQGEQGGQVDPSTGNAAGDPWAAQGYAADPSAQAGQAAQEYFQPPQPYQPQWGQPAYSQMQPPEPGTAFQNLWQANQPQQASQVYPPQPAQPPVPDNISYLHGGIIGEDEREYVHTLRIAQVGGVPDCYLLMECMRNNETVLVNLDAAQDNAEIDRCLDLLYGAACALQCTFNRVSNRSLYLLTPATVQVRPAENIRRQTELEMDARWPDPASLAYQQRVAAREQQAYGGYGGYGAPYQGVSGERRAAVGGWGGSAYANFGGFPRSGR